jgi:hypothetical protein
MWCVGTACSTHKYETTKRMWDDNIKMNLKGMRYENVDWIHVAAGRDGR